MDTAIETYPEFIYPSSSLSAYILCIDLFIISLKNGDIIRFRPYDIIRFGEWLKEHEVRDVAASDTDNSRHITLPLNNSLIKLKRR